MLSGLMGALLSVDNKLQVGQQPTYTLTGAKANSQVYFELYLNGQPYEYGDTNARIVGSDGMLQFTDAPWFSSDVGQWRRVANIIDLTSGAFDSAEIKFTVSPKTIGPQASPTPAPVPAPTPPGAPPTTPPVTTPPVVPPRTIGTPREPIDTRPGTPIINPDGTVTPNPYDRPVEYPDPIFNPEPYPEPPIDEPYYPPLPSPGPGVNQPPVYTAPPATGNGDSGGFSIPDKIAGLPGWLVIAGVLLLVVKGK